MTRARANVLALAGLLASLGPPAASASRIAGTVHIRRGAVAAFSGRGESEQVRRSVNSLRVDLGERLRTSPDVDAIFIAHDETQTPLTASTSYEVARDGLWRTEGEAVRFRVLEFLRRPGRRWRKGLPTTTTSLATVRGDGAPRARGSRDFEASLLDADRVLGPNSSVHTGLEDEILLALVDKGRVLLHGRGDMRVQRKALVLERGWLHLRAGGPARLVLTPRVSVAATEGALYELESAADGGLRVRVLAGEALVGPAPGVRGRKLRLRAGQELSQDPGGEPEVATVLRGARLDAGARGLDAALDMNAPRAAATAAARASEPPEASGENVREPVPLAAVSPDPVRRPSPWERSRRRNQAPPAPAPDPEGPPAVGFAEGPARPGPTMSPEQDEAAIAVAESLNPVPETGRFGSSWETRERRRPRRGRAAPAELPPGLISRGEPQSLRAASHPLWSSAHAVRTPGLSR